MSRSELQLSFRRMTPDDAAAVEAVETACFKIPWSRESFWREASNENTHYLLALDGGDVIGYAGAWIICDEAQITNVAVLPQYRDKGVGRQMMQHMIEGCAQRGASAMTLEVRPSNARALHLYESLGFKSAGRRPGYYEDNGEDAEIMWLTGLNKK